VDGKRPSLLYLTSIVCVLLVHLLLRAHHIAALPTYIDEYRHVSRSQLVYNFAHNPIEFSHGKLLLYYWLGLFSPSGQGAILFSRLAVAVFTLLTGAGIAAIAARLFGREAVLPAIILYALVPHTVFFERLAFADPVAGALGTLSVWQTLILVDRPTRKRALLVGVLISATILTKLTAALLAGSPLIAVMLLGGSAPEERTVSAIRRWMAALWRRYGWALSLIAGVYALSALAIFALVIASLSRGGEPVLFTTHLIGTITGSVDAIGRIIIYFTIVYWLVSIPLAALGGWLAIVLFRAQRAKVLFVLGWLALLWFPAMVLTRHPVARYLTIGYPALAVLFGGGLAHTTRLYRARWTLARSSAGPGASRRLIGDGLVAGVLIVWSLVFAIQFASRTVTAPEKLRLPNEDDYGMFRGPTNGWVVQDALAFLDEHGQALGGWVPVRAVLRTTSAAADFCDLVAFYVTARLDARCTAIVTDEDNDATLAAQEEGIWREVILADLACPFAYVITDVARPQTIPDAPPFAAARVFEGQRPHGGAAISVWRVACE